MNVSISGNLTLPYSVTVNPVRQTKQEQNNITETVDRVSISQKAEELLAKIQEEQAKTDRIDIASDYSLQQVDFYNALGRLLDLKGTLTDKTSFLGTLNKSIADESKSLTKILSGLLNDTGLGEVTKKITFEEDKNGNIIVTGNVNSKKKRKLAEQINKMPELVERIKNQKTKMEILTELNKEDVSDLSQLFSNKPELQEVLSKKLLTQEKLILNTAEYNALQKEFKADHLPKQIDLQKNADESKPLLAIKRGVLSEATDETNDFKEEVRTFREQIGIFVQEYNETIAANNDDLRITEFSVRIDENGNIDFDNVQTRGGDTKQTLRALQFLRKHSGSLHGTAKELATQILDVHDDQHGDVREYKHEVVIDSGVFSDFRIESPDADRAALEKLAMLGNKIGQMLGEYFDLSDQFEITFNADGKLSIDQATLDGLNGKNIRAILPELNKRLESDDPLSNNSFDKKLPNKIEEILEMLVEMKETREQIHDDKLRELPMSLIFVPDYLS
jgi:hypothetical protein